jgi:hypothetical protein
MFGEPRILTAADRGSVRIDQQLTHRPNKYVTTLRGLQQTRVNAGQCTARVGY